MKNILLVAAFIAGLMVTEKSTATHIIGGELTYSYLGNNNYQVNLKVFRDCYNGVAPLDNPCYVGVYNGSNVLVTTLLINLDSDFVIPVSLNCNTNAPGICSEEGIYQPYVINLPPVTGGYTLVYQRCCRSSIINNLADPLSEGISIYETIPDQSLASGNSSPVFSDYPPNAFCIGYPISFDHSATDADGDSLVYELCNGIVGGEDINPQPNPPSAPPYADVTYATPYSGAYPFATSPAFAIDEHTGLITGTPMSIGVFSLAVCVKEYRNGILIGTHRREMAEVFTVIYFTTGFNDVSNDGVIKMFPNPATDKLMIDLSATNQKAEALEIFDASGNSIFEENVTSQSSTASIDLSSFTNGNYFLRISGDGKQETHPFTVTK